MHRYISAHTEWITVPATLSLWTVCVTNDSLQLAISYLIWQFIGQRFHRPVRTSLSVPTSNATENTSAIDGPHE